MEEKTSLQSTTGLLMTAKSKAEINFKVLTGTTSTALPDK